MIDEGAAVVDEEQLVFSKFHKNLDTVSEKFRVERLCLRWRSITEKFLPLVYKKKRFLFGSQNSQNMNGI